MVEQVSGYPKATRASLPEGNFVSCDTIGVGKSYGPRFGGERAVFGHLCGDGSSSIGSAVLADGIGAYVTKNETDATKFYTLILSQFLSMSIQLEKYAS